jgi:hypothetical protein
MALVNHWPLQDDLIDTVAGNDGTATGATISWFDVTNGSRAPIFNDDLTIVLDSTITTASKDTDYTIFFRFIVDTVGAGDFLGLKGAPTVPRLLAVSGTNIYAKVGDAAAGALNTTVTDLGTAEHSLMLTHTSGDDYLTLYLDGADEGTSATDNDGHFNFDAIGVWGASRKLEGKMWDVRLYDSDEITNAVAIDADYQYKAADISSSLEAHWKFEDAAESDTALDETANDYDAAVQGTVTQGSTMATGENTGSCISVVENTANYLDTFSVTVVDAYTMSCWIELDSVTTKNAICGSSNNGSGWHIANLSNTAVAVKTSGDAHNVVMSTALVVDTPTHVAVTRDVSGTLIFYLDGSSVGTTGPQTGSLIVNQIARMGSGSGYGGKMDDLRIYSRALSADNITELYSNPYPGGGGGGDATANNKMGLGIGMSL